MSDQKSEQQQVDASTAEERIQEVIDLPSAIIYLNNATPIYQELG